MAQDAEDGVQFVDLRRRTLSEQVEYLMFQVAMLAGRATLLEAECERLKQRLAYVERATPLKRPKKAPPKKPWDRGI